MQNKAVGFFEGLPLEKKESFIDQLIPTQTPNPQDILVRVKAVSINPVDTKLRQLAKKQEKLRILGFDGTGEVVSVGTAVKKFKVGDTVFYAGTTKRSGSNQEYQLVDERIAALAPIKLSVEETAALPLTALTAYELLFEKFNLLPQEKANQGQSILVINGAGGVGSMLIQLAHWAGLTVYATSSPKNYEWLKERGADYTIDYHQDIVDTLKKLGAAQVDYAAVLHDIGPYFDAVAELIRPFGHIGAIVETQQEIPINRVKNKSVSFDWEYMFAKTDYDYKLETQGEILSLIAKLCDQGKLISTLNKVYSNGINAQTIRQAAADVENGHGKGKVVVSGMFNGDVENK